MGKQSGDSNKVKICTTGRASYKDYPGLFQAAPAAAPSYLLSKQWKCIQVDFSEWQVLFGAHSKWLEIVEISSTTAQRTTAELHKIFAAHGLPQKLV